MSKEQKKCKFYINTVMEKGGKLLGSRIMHSIIGYKIADALSIKEKTQFLHGSIAPDAVFQGEDKNLSHYFVGDAKDFTRSVDYEAFLHTYRSHEKDPYIIGYYTHLIADDIWLKGFYLPWLRNRMEADEELHKLYHNDFRLLNGKLLDYYGFTEEIKEAFSHLPEIIDLEYISVEGVKKLVPYVLGDMEFESAILEEELKVFTLNQIVGYIETSVELGIRKVRQIID